VSVATETNGRTSSVGETGSQMYTKLISLRDQAGEKHFQRITLAQKLLRNKSWVEDPSGGGGDENKALDLLETECFGDLVGLISLVNLLDLLHHFPTVHQWQKYKFNTSRMWAEFSSRQKSEKRKVERVTHSPADIPTPAEWDQFTVIQQKRTYERVLRRVETDENKITRLEEENKQLREENQELRSNLREIKDRARKLIA
jgi:hypothetical protein